MKTVINRSGQPLRVPLPRGRALHLGPGKTGEIGDHALEHPPLKKLLDQGALEVVEAPRSLPSAPAEAGGSVSTHGHAPHLTSGFKGER